jgi:hypothetical protein
MATVAADPCCCRYWSIPVRVAKSALSRASFAPASACTPMACRPAQGWPSPTTMPSFSVHSGGVQLLQGHTQPVFDLHDLL